MPTHQPQGKVFEIYIDDLTDEAKKRLYDLLEDDGPACGPLAIIEFE